MGSACCLFFFPFSTPITHWLGIHFAPRRCHRFEYQTPIKATSSGLFEHHHAGRVRWAARGKGSWNYWVKILMEQSQSPCRCSQRLMLMFSKSHLGNTDIFIYLDRKLPEHEVHALLQHRLRPPGVSQSLQGGGGQPQLSSAGQRTAPTETSGVKSFAEGHVGWWFTRVCESDSLTQSLGNKFLATCYCCTTFKSTINISGWTGCVLYCYRWIHLLTASTE